MPAPIFSPMAESLSRASAALPSTARASPAPRATRRRGRPSMPASARPRAMPASPAIIIRRASAPGSMRPWPALCNIRSWRSRSRLARTSTREKVAPCRDTSTGSCKRARMRASSTALALPRREMPEALPAGLSRTKREHAPGSRPARRVLWVPPAAPARPPPAAARRCAWCPATRPSSAKASAVTKATTARLPMAAAQPMPAIDSQIPGPRPPRARETGGVTYRRRPVVFPSFRCERRAVSAPKALADYAALAEPLLKAFLDEKGAQLPAALQGPHGLLRNYILRGGKRLRGALVLLGCEAAGGTRELAVKASLGCELLHAYLLVHDDFMDRDELRRGGPTLHVSLGREHGAHLGGSIALLLGSLTQSWAHELLLATS